MSLVSMNRVLVEELCELEDALRKVSIIWQRLEASAGQTELKLHFREQMSGFSAEMVQIRKSLANLECPSPGKECLALEGLDEECDEISRLEGDPAVRDAALCLLAQKVQNFLVSEFGGALAHAIQLEHTMVAELLQYGFQEELEQKDKLNLLIECQFATSGRLHFYA